MKCPTCGWTMKEAKNAIKTDMKIIFYVFCDSCDISGTFIINKKKGVVSN